MSAPLLARRELGSTPGCVIVAVDASECSEKAFHWYIKNLHKKDFKVIIAHCMPIPKVFGETDSAAYSAMMADIEEEAEDIRMNYAQLLRELGITASFMSTSASRPDRWLVELCKEEKASMVVLGCRGSRGKARRALLGSTSDYVLHNSRCPVAIHHEHQASKAADKCHNAPCIQSDQDTAQTQSGTHSQTINNDAFRPADAAV